MFTENELRELLQFVSSEPVVSLYLNTDPTAGTKDSYRLRLRNIFKKVDLPEDGSIIEEYFQHQYDWTSRGVAVFSCAPQKYFKVYPLALPVGDLVHVSNRPSVRVLADLLDSYGGYGVVLVDKQGARAFSFHLGELTEQEGVVGAEVKHVKRGGASTVVGARGGIAGRNRHMEEIIERNMKDAADFSVRFFEGSHVRRILIGGTDDNVAMFRSLLPKAWQSLIVGTFPMSMTVGHTEVLARTMEVGREAEIKHENNLVDTLVTRAAKKDGAVIGLEETLEMVNEDRVNTLVVLRGYQQEGYRCKNCTFLTARMLHTCASCGGEMVKVSDVIDRAINRVMRKGGDVVIIHSSRILEDAGSLGAILRF